MMGINFLIKSKLHCNLVAATWAFFKMDRYWAMPTFFRHWHLVFHEHDTCADRLIPSSCACHASHHAMRSLSAR